MPPEDKNSRDYRDYRQNAEQVAAGFWPKVRGLIGRMPFIDEAVAGYFCARDPATPLRVKVTLMAALAYFVVPADAVPDFLAGIGYTDDLAVLIAALKTIGPAITDDHRAQARSALAKQI